MVNLDQRKEEKSKPIIEHNKLTEWNWMVGHPHGLCLGKNVDIGAFTYMNAKYGIIIGDNVEIGGGCHIYSHNSIDDDKCTVIIKSGAKIGAHSVILPGVIIKENQRIPAGSIVHRAGNLVRIKVVQVHETYMINSEHDGCFNCIDSTCTHQGYAEEDAEFFPHFLNECPYHGDKSYQKCECVNR